ncbi:MAG: dTDP-4-dehydrorhamnose 3,5-epimerase [Cyclobacteriaceae bacterium]|jgi:dTDP-4-dehydrorhamnose 3,5-epimerase
MEIIKTPLKDCLIVKSRKYGDDRGFFLETFNQKILSEKGLDFDVKQVNFARSSKNVLRGLHFQKEPYSQGKLIGVVNGAVLDVVADLRPDSPTYLSYFKLELSDPDTLLYVPRGFAHGYYTLEDNTIFHYAVDNFYSPSNESGIRYDDPMLNIDWELNTIPIISNKDLDQPYIKL